LQSAICGAVTYYHRYVKLNMISCIGMKIIWDDSSFYHRYHRHHHHHRHHHFRTEEYVKLKCVLNKSVDLYKQIFIGQFMTDLSLFLIILLFHKIYQVLRLCSVQ